MDARSSFSHSIPRGRRQAVCAGESSMLMRPAVGGVRARCAQRLLVVGWGDHADRGVPAVAVVIVDEGGDGSPGLWLRSTRWGGNCRLAAMTGRALAEWRTRKCGAGPE